MKRPITAEGLVPVELSASQRAALGVRATHCAATTWFGTTIEIGFDNAEAAAMHRRRYARLPASATPDLRGYAVVADDVTYFWIDDGPAFRWDDPLGASSLQFLADVVVRTEYFMERSSLQSFHAATVRVNGCAAAITAASMGGKTTTAIACARRGMPLYSDERCILDGEMVLPFPRAINVRAGSLALLGIDRPGGDWTFIDYPELFGTEELPDPRPLRAIFFIAGRGSEPIAQPMPLETAVAALLGAPLRGRSRGPARVVEATRLLRRARPYALTLGTPDETARLIARTAPE
jgi:hypothetical protein